MSSSLLSYYQDNSFNPVPIDLESPQAWASHVAKRRNLYDHHLGIPMHLLAGKSVLELGCNSGENALVPASLGARMTLAEPNQQVLPRLRTLFEHFRLEGRVVEIQDTDVASFRPNGEYDVVVAEGFLFTLPDRDELLARIGTFLRPGGYGVVSFNDRYGVLIEMVRRYLYGLSCEAEGVGLGSNEGLTLAHTLYHDDYARISASRPFPAWWRDVLANPFIVNEHLWSYGELIPLLERMGCEVHGTSPRWSDVDHFTWYKNVPEARERHQHLLNSFRSTLAFFLSGTRPEGGHDEPAGEEVLAATTDFVAAMSRRRGDAQASRPAYPAPLDTFLSASRSATVRALAAELRTLVQAMHQDGQRADGLAKAYHASLQLRRSWGSPYHYLSFQKAG